MNETTPERVALPPKKTKVRAAVCLLTIDDKSVQAWFAGRHHGTVS